ncbi:MAG: hypothetical protein GY704_12595, partial [Phycisphaeraceae bacterium]|nr:hypothetical protein [Phycisphaeraceae bacterium]
TVTDLVYDERRNLLWAAGWSSSTIRTIDLATGDVTTIAGLPGVSGTTDGRILRAPFDMELIDDGSTLLVADENEQRIYRFAVIDSHDGPTLAPPEPIAGRGGIGSPGATGAQALEARFRRLTGITTMPGGGIVIVDGGNDQVSLLSDGRLFPVAVAGPILRDGTRIEGDSIDSPLAVDYAAGFLWITQGGVLLRLDP